MNFLETFSDSLPTESELEQLEAELGFGLPCEYREFLLEVNGGVLAPPYCVPVDGLQSDEYLELRTLYGFGTGEAWSDLMEARNMCRTMMPPELLPIGFFELNCQLCIEIFGENLGSIYHWDFLLKPDYPSRENCHFICRSFSEFDGLLFNPD